MVVRTEFLGEVHEGALRRDGDVFYCDTPTGLHRHESREEMRTCIEKRVRQELTPSTATLSRVNRG